MVPLGNECALDKMQQRAWWSADRSFSCGQFALRCHRQWPLDAAGLRTGSAHTLASAHPRLYPCVASLHAAPHCHAAHAHGNVYARAHRNTYDLFRGAPQADCHTYGCSVPVPGGYEGRSVHLRSGSIPYTHAGNRTVSHHSRYPGKAYGDTVASHGNPRPAASKIGGR